LAYKLTASTKLVTGDRLGVKLTFSCVRARTP
jgi:hypothetical protein